VDLRVRPLLGPAQLHMSLRPTRTG